MHNIFGESNKAKIAKVCKSNSELANNINTLITDIFKYTSGYTCNEREQIIYILVLHNARIDSKQMANITKTFECNSVPSKYMYILVLLEIITKMCLR